MKLSCAWLLISCWVCLNSRVILGSWKVVSVVGIREAQKPFLSQIGFFFFVCLIARVQLCFVFLRKIAAAVGCAGLFCGHRLGVSGGERLAVVISPCLASGQAANCFSGLVPPGGICLQEKFPYSQVWAAELWLSQRHCFWLLRWINYVSSYGVGAGNICGCSEWKSYS